MNGCGCYCTAMSVGIMSEYQNIAYSNDVYPPGFFTREDESEDKLFYKTPRLVVHIDEYAVSAISNYLKETLPRKGIVLDLMSSWRSHIPEDHKLERIIGIGMNETEMSENNQLDEVIIHDLNRNPEIPINDESVDAVVVTVSIQYMTKPLEVFREINRVLKKGGFFHVIYSNRMFPSKAIAAWMALTDLQRAQLIETYFNNSAPWTLPTFLNLQMRTGFSTDPVYVVSASVI